MTEDEFTLYLFLTVTIIISIFALYIAVLWIAEMQELSLKAVKECVEMNKAANATVCLV